MASTVAIFHTDRWSRHVRKAERDGDLCTSRERCSGRGRRPQASHLHRTSSHIGIALRRACAPHAPGPSHHFSTSQQSVAPPLEKHCNPSSRPSKSSHGPHPKGFFVTALQETYCGDDHRDLLSAMIGVGIKHARSPASRFFPQVGELYLAIRTSPASASFPMTASSYRYRAPGGIGRWVAR